MDYYVVGDRIREFREKNNLSQDELAELASIHRVTLSRYESGKVDPGAQALGRIADALNVSTDTLLGRNTSDQDQKKRAPQTIEARIVSAGIDKMPKEDREFALEMFNRTFAAIYAKEGKSAHENAAT